MRRPTIRRTPVRTLSLVLASGLAAVLFNGSQTAAAAPAPALLGAPHLMKSIGAASSSAAATAAAPLTYQTANGPVETAPTIYLVFWGTQWQVGWSDVSTSSGTVYTSSQSMNYITGFFNYIGGSATSWFGSQSQYCSGVAVGTVNCGSAGAHVGNPPKFGGSWVDTSSVPPPPVVPDNCAVAVCLNSTGSPLDQANLIGQEALRAQSHFLGASGHNANADFLVMLPKATGSPGYGSYCAYHSAITDASGRAVSFTNMPYDLDVNTLCGQNFVNSTDNAFGNGYMDGYSIVAGHEIAEAATDAVPGTASAWRDSGGQETGDKCAWITPGTTGGSYNIGPDASGHYYAVQSLWSNTANGCV